MTHGFYVSDEDRKNAAGLLERVTFYCKGLVIPDPDHFVQHVAWMFGAVRSAQAAPPSDAEINQLVQACRPSGETDGTLGTVVPMGFEAVQALVTRFARPAAPNGGDPQCR